MPKLKTHKGIAKRFKVTGTGKVVRKKAAARHLKENKRGKQVRQMRSPVTVPSTTAKQVKSLIHN